MNKLDRLLSLLTNYHSSQCLPEITDSFITKILFEVMDPWVALGQILDYDCDWSSWRDLYWLLVQVSLGKLEHTGALCNNDRKIL